jgi:hypothetical protein
MIGDSSAMDEYGDFQEIAHCGGQVTINIVCDAEGHRSVSAGFRHSSPTPASVLGIYALTPQGIPVADFAMGGIGSDAAVPQGCFWVFLGSDSRFCWGHQCNRCQGYFRNGNHPAVYPLSCPYCGFRGPAYALLTPAQLNYVRHYMSVLDEALNQDMENGTEREFVIDMDAVTRQSADLPRPQFYYASESQQTQYDWMNAANSMISEVSMGTARRVAIGTISNS